MHVVVIGGGPAGASGAVRAAELGADVTLVEADRLGGTCVNRGCVPTRVLARTARMAREARTASTWGVHAHDVHVEWPEVRQRVRDTVELVHRTKDLAGELEAVGVEVLLGDPGRLTGPRRVTVGDSELDADAVTA